MKNIPALVALGLVSFTLPLSASELVVTENTSFTSAEELNQYDKVTVRGCDISFNFGETNVIVTPEIYMDCASTTRRVFIGIAAKSTVTFTGKVHSAPVGTGNQYSQINSQGGNASGVVRFVHPETTLEYVKYCLNEDASTTTLALGPVTEGVAQTAKIRQLEFIDKNARRQILDLAGRDLEIGDYLMTQHDYCSLVNSGTRRARLSVPRLSTTSEGVLKGVVDGGEAGMIFELQDPNLRDHQSVDAIGASFTNAELRAVGTKVSLSDVRRCSNVTLVRFWPIKTRPDDGTQGANFNSGWQIAEFQLLSGGQKVAWPSGTTTWTCREPGSSEKSSKAIDGTNDKFYSPEKSLVFDGQQTALYVTLPSPVSFDAFNYKTANDSIGRDLVSFRLDIGTVANGSTNWTTVCEQHDAEITKNRHEWTQKFSALSAEYDLMTTTRPSSFVMSDAHVDIFSTAGAVTLGDGFPPTSLGRISGTGSIFVDNPSGVRLTEDYSAFTGFVSASNVVSLAFATETLVPPPVRMAGLPIRNDGTDASFDVTNGVSRLFGALQDGTAQVGLSVSEGSELRVLATPSNVAARATYTGATTVGADSVLSLAGTAALTARYFRFTPLKSFNGDAWATNRFLIGELKLMRDGVEIPWPFDTRASSDNTFTSPTNLIDGSAAIGCRWQTTSKWKDHEGEAYTPVVLTTPEPVRFDGYCWYVGATDVGCDPRAWSFEYSSDGENWTLLDEKDFPARNGNFVVARSSRNYVFCVNKPRTGALVPVCARYLRLTPLRNRGNQDRINVQLSEFRLRHNGAEIFWPSGTTCVSTNAGASESAANLIDNTVNTKCYWGRNYQYIDPAVFKLPKVTTFSGYSWYTANDSTERDMVDWIVEYSMNGKDWVIFDNVNGASITTDRNVFAYAFDNRGVDVPAAETDMLSDDSAITLDDGAVLKVESVKETVGSLAGAGSVTLAGRDCVLTVKTTTDATLSGSLQGNGTFVKTGAARETLSGQAAFDGTIVVEEGTLDLSTITLSGVTNIVLKGGTLTGTATIDGDLALSGEAGVCAATLNVAGTLTISGTLTAQFDAALPCNLTAQTLALVAGTKIVVDARAAGAPEKAATPICAASSLVGTLDPKNVSFLTTSENEQLFRGATVVTQRGTNVGLWVHVNCGLVILFR